MERTSVAGRRIVRARRPDQLGYERLSIRAGIEMVASGAARRVVLCGLRYAERLLPGAVERGTSAGLTVHLDRTADGPAAIVIAAPKPPQPN